VEPLGAGVLGRPALAAVVRLADEAAAAPADPVRARRLERMLEVLPLPEDVEHPAYRGVLERLAQALSDQGVLRGAAGERLAPGAAALLEDPGLASPLAGVPLDPGGRRALQPLPDRARRAARALGAARFGSRELVALLASALAGLREGDAPPQPWLERGLRCFLDSLGRTAEAEGLEALAALPLLPDQDGRLWRAASLSRADRELRAVYGGSRRLLEASLDLLPGPGEAALLEALGVPRLGPADLVRDLADPAFARRVVAERGAAALFEYLSGRARSSSPRSARCRSSRTTRGRCGRSRGRRPRGGPRRDRSARSPGRCRGSVPRSSTRRSPSGSASGSRAWGRGRWGWASCWRPSAAAARTSPVRTSRPSTARSTSCART
jgi:hypothetical protein